MAAISPRGSTKRCVFCELLAGDGAGGPVDLVAETASFVAILDRSPVFWGHTLMIPRRHTSTFDELDPTSAQEWFGFAQRLVRGVEAGVGAQGSLMIVNNVVSQSVPHVHLHVIPRVDKDGLSRWLGPRHPYRDDAHRLEVSAAVRAAIAANGGAGLR